METGNILSTVMKEIAKHFDLDESKFHLERDDYLPYIEISHPQLYHTITKTDNCWIVGHYHYIPGVHYHMDGTGEPDDYKPVDDFECDTELEAVKKLIELEEKHRVMIEF